MLLKEGDRKGQVTLFIIISILIVSLVILFVFKDNFLIKILTLNLNLYIIVILNVLKVQRKRVFI